MTDDPARGDGPAGAPPKRLREISHVLRNARKAFGLLVEADRKLATGIVLLTFGAALLPVSIAWVGKRLIDDVVAAGQGVPGAGTSALWWVALECVLVVSRSSVAQLTQLAQAQLRLSLGLKVNTMILEKAVNVSYGHFEDADFNDKLSQARREASSRPLDVVRQLLLLVRNSITLAGYATILAGFSGWAVLVLLGSALPPFLAEARFGRKAFLLNRSRMFDNRRAHYIEVLLSREDTAKEVKLFSLSGLLLRRYRAFFERFHREDKALARRRANWAIILGVLSVLTLYACYAWVVSQAVAGALTVGTMTLYLVAFREGQTSFQDGLLAVAKLYEDNLFMTNLFEYLAIPEDEPHEPLPGELMALSGDDDGEAGAEMIGTPPRIELRDVSFQYPGSARESLRGVTLTIEPGETIAVVGPNGAGKTTLVKLLTGLYQPTTGTILLDGADITTLSTAALRARVGVIFQDFVRFHFTVAENIGVGWIPEMENREEIERAAAAGGIEDVIRSLPEGYGQGLGRWFGGEELSVGQWQRLALARAFMRRSPILVLDEPTAALDAEAEVEIFSRFRSLAAERTAILITHRFSTVRMADRIVVFEDGRLTEDGSHADLLERGGRYAKMFRLQAAGYSDD
ncbi:MAG: ABC transporter ATP-binding protein [Candidatus Binatia bacterium]|nr:ABC transporter ATP-binding protein [Candidatus Binatia bacterium]